MSEQPHDPFAPPQGQPLPENTPAPVDFSFEGLSSEPAQSPPVPQAPVPGGGDAPLPFGGTPAQGGEAPPAYADTSFGAAPQTPYQSGADAGQAWGTQPQYNPDGQGAEVPPQSYGQPYSQQGYTQSYTPQESGQNYGQPEYTQAYQSPPADASGTAYPYGQGGYAAPVPEAPKKKSRLPVILLVILLIAGLGTGGFFWWRSQNGGSGSNGSRTTAAAREEDEDEDEKDEREDSRSPSGGSSTPGLIPPKGSASSTSTSAPSSSASSSREDPLAIAQALSQAEITEIVSDFYLSYIDCINYGLPTKDTSYLRRATPNVVDEVLRRFEAPGNIQYYFECISVQPLFNTRVNNAPGEVPTIDIEVQFSYYYWGRDGKVQRTSGDNVQRIQLIYENGEWLVNRFERKD